MNRSISRHFFLFASLFALVGLGSTYLITKPEDDNEIWYFGQKRLVRWESVSTDPDWVTISISNNDAGVGRTYPTAFNRVIRRGVPKERGKFLLKEWVFEGLQEGTGYRINILTKDAGSILAQSPIFTLSSWDESDTSPSIDSDKTDSDDKGEDDHQKQTSKSDNEDNQKQTSKSDNEDKQKQTSKSDSVDHHKQPSKSDNDVEVAVSESDKKASDQTLVKKARNIHSRVGCRPRADLGPDVVSIIRRGH